MIITMLLGIVGAFFDALPVIEWPSLDILNQYLGYALEYFIGGISVLQALIGAPAMSILKLYLTIVIILNSFYLAYQMLWWFIKKIPLLDIRQ